MEKSNAAFQKDQYEKYEMVERQKALHLADELWGLYPMQPVYDFAEKWLPVEPRDILEIGCGVGRWIADMAIQYQEAQCWVIDYSYQMLRVASDYWKNGKELTIDNTSKGYPNVITKSGHSLPNLHFGLTRSEELPFGDVSQDLVVSSFLIDRVDDIVATVGEMRRVLRDSGRLILVSPLNYQQPQQWIDFYPLEKLKDLFYQLGFALLDQREDIIIHEPLDAHGNEINWNCIGLITQKKA